MRVAPKTFLWISLAAHVAIGAAVYRGASHPAVAAAPSPGEPDALLSGDTFEVPEELPAPAPAPEAVPTAGVDTTAPSRAPSLSSAGPHTEQAQARTGGGESVAGTVFGASSDRASVDLATAFTRGFPQAASADPAWAAAPFGPAGEAIVVLEESTIRARSSPRGSRAHPARR